MSILLIGVVVIATTPNIIEIDIPPLPMVEVFDMEQYIVSVALEYDISPVEFLGVAQCESYLNPTIQSYVVDSKGVREDSWGVFQIHLPSHPDVTREQAIDPFFAVPWSAQKFADGRSHLWSCSRILGYN